MGQLLLLVLHLFLSDVEACAVFTSHGAAVKLSWQVPVPSGVWFLHCCAFEESLSSPTWAVSFPVKKKGDWREVLSKFTLLFSEVLWSYFCSFQMLCSKWVLPRL